MRKTNLFVIAMTVSLAGCLSGEFDEAEGEEGEFEELEDEEVAEAATVGANLTYKPFLAKDTAASTSVSINYTKGNRAFRINEIVYEVKGGVRNNSKIGIDVEVLSNGKWIELLGNWDLFYENLGKNASGVLSPRRTYDPKGLPFRFKVYASWDFVGPDPSKTQYITIR
ncbi:MAG: hypothetical protein ACKV2T_37380 [Kofleriaceae bacterium]